MRFLTSLPGERPGLSWASNLDDLAIQGCRLANIEYQSSLSESDRLRFVLDITSGELVCGHDSGHWSSLEPLWAASTCNRDPTGQLGSYSS